MRLIDELNTFYNTNFPILDLTNGRLPPVHMVTKLSIASHQLPCNTSIQFHTIIVIIQDIMTTLKLTFHNHNYLLFTS